jgi:hypothetical protein
MDETLPAPRFRLIEFGDIEVADSTPWLVKDMIPRDGLTVIWGPPKCGKSFWTHDLVMHVALGWPYRGRSVTKGPVVYVACEGGRGLRARIEAWRRERLESQEYLVPFWLLPDQLDLVAEVEELAVAIRDTISPSGARPPVAIVLDTLNRSLAGSENSDEDMGEYIKAADALRGWFGCAVIVVHHCGHDGTRPRGHTSLAGALDCQIAVKREGDLIVTAVERMKDGPEGATTVSHLQVVEVGTDADDDPITSCLIEPADDERPPAPAPKLSPRQKRALDVLGNALVDGGHTAPENKHYPPGEIVVPTETWRESLFAAGVLDQDASNPRQDFKRLRDSLADKGHIREWNGLLWRCHA